MEKPAPSPEDAAQVEFIKRAAAAMALTKFRPVESSNLQAIAYSSPARILYVTFKSGETYAYEEVTQEKFNAVMDAPSVGSAFHSEIKKAEPQHRWCKVPTGPLIADLVKDGVDAIVEHKEHGRFVWKNQYGDGYCLYRKAKVNVGQHVSALAPDAMGNMLVPVPADAITLLSRGWKHASTGEPDA